MPADLLQRLAEVLESRKQADAQDSYVASLYAGGNPAICAKISEEAAETVDAAAEDDNEHLVHEVADLWFHSLVLLHHRGLSAEDVLRELDKRFGLSGHDEKASRGPGSQGPDVQAGD